MPRKIVGKCLLLDILNRSYMYQSELSERTGIDTASINKYIHNERIMTLNNAKLIADALHCKIEDLYDWSYDK